MRLAAASYLLALPALAQPDLSLSDAVKQALDQHPSIEATAARVKAAATRLDQARGARLPKVNYSESWQRSDNPVFVFSSLLTQHRFTTENFTLGPLNRPDFLNNFQSLVSVDQTIYDGGQAKAGILGAQIGQKVAGEEGRRTRMELIARVVRAYYENALAAEGLAVAKEAVRSSESDLARARHIRAAGMSTDADVLSIRVQVAAMREREIRRAADADVARAALNETLGLPLDTDHKLTTPLVAASMPDLGPDTGLEGLAKAAVAARPEIQEARLGEQIAQAHSDAARSALLPQVSIRGAFEADRQRFVTQGGANWFVGATMRWNLFDGFTNRGRIAEAAQDLRGARAQTREMSAGVEMQVRRAHAEWKSAGERIEVASASIAMAEESLRITRDRYEAGLATVNDLLQRETALLEAKMRKLAAVYEQRLSAVMLDLAAGTLDAGSPSLK